MTDGEHVSRTAEVVDTFLTRLADGEDVTLQHLCDRMGVDSAAAEQALATQIKKLVGTLAGQGCRDEPFAAEDEKLGPEDVGAVLDEIRSLGLLRYEIGAPVVSGKTVYRAWDRYLGTTIALKRLEDLRRTDGSTDDSLGADGVRAFFAEARTAARLQHPAVPPVHAVGVDDAGRPWYAMALVEGQSFGDVLEDAALGRVALGRVLWYVQRVAEALRYVHEHHRLVHCDIKPENVVIGRFDRVYVLDWGAACAVGVAPRQGSPGYMCEAQEDGQAARPKYDVYAIGALIRDLIHSVRDSPVDMHLIRDRALGCAGDQDYKDMDGLLRELGDYMDGRCVAGGTLRRLAKWARRQPAAAILAGGLMLGAVTGAALYVGSALGHRAAVIRAWSDADPVAFVDHALASGPVAAAAAAILPAVIREESRRLATDPRHPLLMVRQALQMSRQQGLAEAAGFLRLSRIGSDEVDWLMSEASDPAHPGALEFHEKGGLAATERAFVWRFLARSVSTDVAKQSPRSGAIALLGRLLLESPDDTPGESIETAGLRALLRESVSRLPVGSPSRMWAIAALGGCGTMDEAVWMASLPEVREGPDHLRNPVLCNIANVVGRLHLIGAPPLTGTQVQELIRMITGSESEVGVEEVLRACLAHRFFVRGRWGREIVEPLRGTHGFTIDLLLDLDDEDRARQKLLNGEYRVYPSLLGFACALLERTKAPGQSRGFVDAVCTRCPADLRSAFATGLESGRRVAQAREAVFELIEPLDRTSFLMPRSWLPATTAASTLPCDRGSSDGSMASWGFRLERPVYTGAATGRVTGVGVHYEEESSCWRLTRSEWSQVTVEFEVTSAAFQAVELAIRHLAASRTSMPWEGEAEIEVELDGGSWMERAKVFEPGGHDARFRIPGYWLSQGKHCLTIQLVHNTTTYWLKSIVLEPPNAK